MKCQTCVASLEPIKSIVFTWSCDFRGLDEKYARKYSIGVGKVSTPLKNMSLIIDLKKWLLRVLLKG